MKIKCPRCGCENYFTGLEDENARFCSNCNEPLFNEKIPLLNSFEEISSAALSAIAKDKSNKDIIAILKQGVNLIDKSTSENIKNMNFIASLLARPRFKEVETAVKFWERIIELDPLNFGALRFLVSFYIMQGRDKDVYQKGILILDSDYRNCIVEDKKIARLMGSSAKEFDVQNPEKSTSTLYGFLGNFYSEHNDYALAINTYNIALDINPNNIDALNNIAVIYFRKKEYSEALKYYKKCLEVTPVELQKEYRETVEKYSLDPIKSERLPSEAKANQMIKKAESEILFNIGECLFMLNEIDDARDAFRWSIEKSEEYPHRELSEVVEEILAEIRKKYGVSTEIKTNNRKKMNLLGALKKELYINKLTATYRMVYNCDDWTAFKNLRNNYTEQELKQILDDLLKWEKEGQLETLLLLVPPFKEKT